MDLTTKKDKKGKEGKEGKEGKSGTGGEGTGAGAGAGDGDGDGPSPPLLRSGVLLEGVPSETVPVGDDVRLAVGALMLLTEHSEQGGEEAWRREDLKAIVGVLAWAKAEVEIKTYAGKAGEYTVCARACVCVCV